MTGLTPEFSRPFAIDSIGTAARAVTIEANEAERAALATRFGFAAIDRLAAEARLVTKSGMIVADGRVTASVIQSCVVTGEPLPAEVVEDFSLRFLSEADAAGEEEIELAAEDCDTVFYGGDTIDLGEAVAETVALALDPFPRAPGADEALRAAGVISEAEAGPFGALKGLKDKLGG